MFLKLMGALPGSIYATSRDGIYVNLFVGSEAAIEQDNLDVSVRQTTLYPWDGIVRLTITPKKATSFAMNLRVPEWCRGAEYRLNGSLVEPQTVQGYARFERVWHPDDTLEFVMPFPVQRVKADHRIAADIGRVALMRGPIVYCLEGLDNGGHVGSLVLTNSGTILAEHRPDLLGGMTVLRGNAQIVRERSTPTYPLGKQTVSQGSFTAIPFYGNTNRRSTEMVVWIADEIENARALTLAGSAVPTASHCNATDFVWALNDAKEPRASDDDTVSRFTWWDHRGTEEWVQYEFPIESDVSGVEVYWWDERRVQRECRVPQSWSVQYLIGDEWSPVIAATAYGTDMDKYNRVLFDAVKTKALRIAVQLQAGWSGGIMQWRVLEPDIVG
jgi:hypothetical protein